MAKARILLVDDLEDPRTLACTLLTKHGYEVVCADSGMAAIAAVRKSHTERKPFDLIMLDIALQDIDGYSVAEIIRVLERVEPPHPPVKIAFFTAYTRSLVNDDMMKRAGVNVVWDKLDAAPRLPQLVKDCLAGDCDEEDAQ